MGGDGGVIAVKRKFIRGAKSEDGKDDKKNIKQQLILRTRICLQSSEPLHEPIVCCELGHLYNKEAMLNALINKSVNTACSHVRGLKDLRTLIFAVNPTGNPSPTEESKDDGNPGKFMCPITKVEFNGIQPFVAIWTTGYVLSERALKEMGYKALQEEYGPFTADDIIRLAPTDEELDDLRNRMVARRNRAKEDKASKKLSAAGGERIKEDSKKRKHSAASNADSAPSDIHSHTTIPEPNPVNADLPLQQNKAGPAKRLNQSNTLVRSAAAAIEGQLSSSAVFKKLFHKDKEKDQQDRDLFMSGVGLRYSYT